MERMLQRFIITKEAPLVRIAPNEKRQNRKADWKIIKHIFIKNLHNRDSIEKKRTNNVHYENITEGIRTGFLISLKGMREIGKCIEMYICIIIPWLHKTPLYWMRCINCVCPYIYVESVHSINLDWWWWHYGVAAHPDTTNPLKTHTYTIKDLRVEFYASAEIIYTTTTGERALKNRQQHQINTAAYRCIMCV